MASLTKSLVAGLAACLIAVNLSAAENHQSTNATKSAKPQAGDIKRSHKGITFFAQPPAKEVHYDTSNLPGNQALNKLIQSIDLIYKQLPKSKSAIERLKRAGDVYIGYVPGALEKGLSSTIRVAIYAPDFFKQAGARRRFVTIVGRHGIKWPLRELTAVLVHEITGHATQNLENRLKKMRSIDAECEAWLLEEYANQRLEFNKKKRKIINFRKQLELKWCKPFKNYLRKNRPQSLKAWDRLNPQVFTVLAAFPGYLAHLEKSGALKREKTLSKNLRNQALNKTLKSAKPAHPYEMGKRLWKGDIGIPQNKAKALEWFRHSAKGGHIPAQYILGHLLQTGQTGKRDYKQAFHWFQQAAATGHKAARTRIAVMYITGKGTKPDKAQGLTLLLKTAHQNFVPAQRTLGFLYKDGINVNKDPITAYIWFSRAAKQGDKKAMLQLNDLKKSITPEQLTKAKSRLSRSSKK